MKPDLALLDDVVASKVLDALKIASSALTRIGVRHVVVGSLAVGAHGSPSAGHGVAFLVGDEAFEEHPGGFISMRPGVPIQVNGVAIDIEATRRYLSANAPQLVASFEEAVARAAAEE